MNKKTCSVCKQEKSLIDFNKKYDGLRPSCRKCDSIKTKEYKKNNYSKYQERWLRNNRARKNIPCSVCGTLIDSRAKTGKCVNCVHLVKNPSYSALHTWVKKRLPKTELCQHCNEVKPYDLANKGTYDRNLNNWEWLCRRCHMISDGRMVNLKNQGDRYGT